MMSEAKVTSAVFAGLGGQGILKASDILAEAAFHAGWDVKKSEIHGMSQRGGSVTSDVRFGPEVFSPMTPVGEADYLVVVDSTQVECVRHVLRAEGVLITPEWCCRDGLDLEQVLRDGQSPLTRRNLNVALLGALSVQLHIVETDWLAALRANLSPASHAANEQVFAWGRDLAQKRGRK